MPSSQERRSIEFFVREYNSIREPQIEFIKDDEQQEAPDSICWLSNGQTIALELTSVGAPKKSPGARFSPHKAGDLFQLKKILDRKFQYDYRISGADEVWLVVDIRFTVPKAWIEEAIDGIAIPSRFDKVFLQWALPEKTDRIPLNLLELPNYDYLLPDFPRPCHNKHKLLSS